MPAAGRPWRAISGRSPQGRAPSTSRRRGRWHRNPRARADHHPHPAGVRPPQGRPQPGVAGPDDRHVDLGGQRPGTPSDGWTGGRLHSDIGVVLVPTTPRVREAAVGRRRGCRCGSGRRCVAAAAQLRVPRGPSDTRSAIRRPTFRCPLPARLPTCRCEHAAPSRAGHRSAHAGVGRWPDARHLPEPTSASVRSGVHWRRDARPPRPTWHHTAGSASWRVRRAPTAGCRGGRPANVGVGATTRGDRAAQHDRAAVRGLRRAQRDLLPADRLGERQLHPHWRAHDDRTRRHALGGHRRGPTLRHRSRRAHRGPLRDRQGQRDRRPPRDRDL